MSKLIIGSNNKHKVEEIKAILGGFYDEVLSLKEAGITLNVDEDQETFEGNAVKKAMETFSETGFDTLADDSGLSVDALGGAPGVYSARYAGEYASDEDNNARLLKELDGVKDRSAKFVCVIALVRQGQVMTAKGEAAGRIICEPMGEGGFGYDPLFYSFELGKTFAQASAQEKNAVSHRARALFVLKQKLSGQDTINSET